MIRARIRVFGEVQGVSFRYAASKEANHLGLFGFAQNEADGTVLIEVEGKESLVHRFIDWCHEGSTRSVVKSVDYTSHEPIGHKGFDIR
jgi:acylphosphatase